MGVAMQRKAFAVVRFCIAIAAAIMVPLTTWPARQRRLDPMPDDNILAAIAALETRIDTAIAGTRAALESRIDTAVAGTRAALEARIDGLNASLSGRMDRIDDAATSFRVAVMERFDRMETRFTEIRDDITVTMGRADKAHEAADHTREELRSLSKEVAILTNKQRMLESKVFDLTRPSGDI